jgi:hypothetical protein
LFALLTAFSALALADSWQGRLIDAACYEHAPNKSAASCDPTTATTTFALFVSGKTYNLDMAGNSKATEAMKNRADRSTDPAKLPGEQISVKVTGTKDGGMIKVETLEVQ